MYTESVLRTNLVGSFVRIDDHGLGKLTSIIGDTYGGLVKGVVTNQLLVETTSAAVKNDRWTGSTNPNGHTRQKNRIGVGYYSDDAVYNTNFTHELCHNMVWQMGRPNYVYEDYVEMATEEERMCWQFSIELLTRPPYIRQSV